MTKTYNLFFECISNNLKIALINNEEIIDYSQRKIEKNITDIIIREINLIFKKNKIKKTDIESIYTINGPGNYSGVKTTPIIANLFCKILNCNIFYLSSCFFQNIEKNVISIVDAKSNLFYTMIINNDQNPNEKIELKSIEEINLIAKQNNLKIINNIDNYNLNDCWKKHKNNFIKTDFLEPNYVKKPI